MRAAARGRRKPRLLVPGSASGLHVLCTCYTPQNKVGLSQRFLGEGLLDARFFSFLEMKLTKIDTKST